MLPFTRRNLVGVDIGSYSIKVVKIRGKEGDYTLEAACSFRNPAFKGDSSGVAGILADFIRARKMGGGGFSVKLPGNLVTIRHLNLPVMPKRDLKEAVAWEMRKESTISSEELVCDFVILSEMNEQGGSGYSIIAFGARKEEVISHLKVFDDIPGEVMAVDVTPMALLASFDLNTQWEKGLNYALIDIGGGSTTLTILKDKKMRFTREISVGGREMTLAIAHGKRIEEEEAEAEKIRWGLEREGSEKEGIRDLILPVVERLTNEINLSFDYYQAQFREGGIGRVFLAGGASLLEGLDAYLEGEFNVPCFIDDPLRGVKVPKIPDISTVRQCAPAFAVAVGLATRKA